MNVKATLSPDDLARACADAMWKDDDASSGLGMEILDVRAGEATLAMTVQPHMVNGQRIAHGGFIFTLADSAFAFACNSHNKVTVANNCAISFIAPARAGDVLTADAVERHRGGRSGITDVTVTDQTGRLIAAFRGHSTQIKGELVPGLAGDG